MARTKDKWTPERKAKWMESRWGKKSHQDNQERGNSNQKQAEIPGVEQVNG